MKIARRVLMAGAGAMLAVFATYGATAQEKKNHCGAACNGYQ